MNKENYYENEKDKNEIIIEEDELNLNQFVLNDEKNRDNQVLFHGVLKIMIDKYNTLSEEQRREEGIFYLKHSNILLGSITEEIIQSYYEYKELFDGLMARKARFFREYYPKLDKNSNKAFSENNNRYNRNNRNNNANTLLNILSEYVGGRDNLTCNNQQLLHCEDYEDHRNKQKKIKYNLEHFSLYFNGMYFESIALEIFFKLIEDKYDRVDSDKKLISFLPRIIFFNKNSEEAKNNNKKDFYGYSEIDCVFVFNEMEKLKIEKEKITCFDNFNIIDESLFFNKNNFVNLIIEKDNVVFWKLNLVLEVL